MQSITQNHKVFLPQHTGRRDMNEIIFKAAVNPNYLTFLLFLNDRYKSLKHTVEGSVPHFSCDVISVHWISTVGDSLVQHICVDHNGVVKPSQQNRWLVEKHSLNLTKRQKETRCRTDKVGIVLTKRFQQEFCFATTKVLR